MCKGKVLVVDDEPICLLILSTLIRYEGFEVHEASSGEEALSKLDASFHAVLTDMHMGKGLNGNDVAAAAKSLKSDMSVMLTYSPYKIAPIAERFDNIFTKPINFGLVVAALSLIK